MKRFDFVKNKYGTELLVDLGRVESLQNYVLDCQAHYITFYEVMIVLEGEGTYSLDDETVTFSRGTIIVTLPNQVRNWQITSAVRGFSFFFEGEFLNAYFQDDVFLNRFVLFDYARPFIFAQFDEHAFGKCVWVLKEVEQEFQNFNQSSSHIFRSLLYYLISLIDRQYRRQHQIQTVEVHPVISRFKKLINLHFKEWHTVADYANAINISHNQLNALCKVHLTATALKEVHRRILLEAKRDILFSGKTMSEIGFNLGFSDVSNFNRFFKKQTGQTPKSFYKNRQ